MGIISQGILGGISGKVGNVVGASWKGIHYLRIMPASIANPRTPKQVNQRTKFAATLAFLQPALAFIKEGYRFHQNKQSAFNAAMSYVLNNAITGEAPDFTVDYANALVSRGSRAAVAIASMLAEPNLVTVQWEDNSTDLNAASDDRAMVLIYNVTKKSAVVQLDGSATRVDTTAQVTLPENYAGDTLQVYLAFQAADASAVSNSIYVGTVVAAE